MAKPSVGKEANDRVLVHLRALRAELGGQAAVAEAIGVSQGTVSALLHGRQWAGVRVVRGLAKHLRVPTSQLMGTEPLRTRKAAPEFARVDEVATRLYALVEATEARIEEVDERTTALAIGQGNIGAALDRTEALVARLDGLESRAAVLEAAYAKRAKVTISRAIVLGGPALAWVKGDISAGRFAEVLTAWLNGKDHFTAEDVGLEAWPEPPEWMGDEDHIPW